MRRVRRVRRVRRASLGPSVPHKSSTSPKRIPRSTRTVPTGEVVAILRPRGADFVATVSAEDAEEIERGASGESSRAVFGLQSA